MIEISVIIKDSERRYKRDFIEYETFTTEDNDPILNKCVKTTLEEFRGEPDSIVIKFEKVMK